MVFLIWFFLWICFSGMYNVCISDIDSVPAWSWWLTEVLIGVFLAGLLYISK